MGAEFRVPLEPLGTILSWDIRGVLNYAPDS